QGNFIVEGNIGFNSTNDKASDTKTSSFNLSPKVGYFFTDDLAVGVELDLGSSKINDEKTNSFGAALFARYYFLELGERFKTYGELGLGFASLKQGDAKASGFGAGLDLGINYFVTETIAINFGLSDVLSFSSFKPKGGDAYTEFNGNINVFNNFFDTAQFGLTFKF
ncbi:MAG: outer membrane beta-barrel protein, partial [Weeksellaceae bacterium]|nr:outer membrane beta-barrel protein [Weeksellaceae bacterium]